jgi:hypothetical protein
MMSLITDKLVWVMHTAALCRHNTLAKWAENVLSLYRFCRAAIQAAPCIFVCAACPGRLGQPVRTLGIITLPQEVQKLVCGATVLLPLSVDLVCKLVNTDWH